MYPLLTKFARFYRNLSRDELIGFGLTGTLLIGCIIIVIYVIWKDESYKTELKNADANISDEDTVTFGEMMDGKKNEDILKGKTSKYEWYQTSHEIEMYLLVNSLGVDVDTKTLSSKDIQVNLLAYKLSVTLLGKVVIDDYLFDEIDPNECNWQLEKDDNNNIKIWITLIKKAPNRTGHYWRYILANDEIIEKTAAGKPIHRIDPNDPASIRSAMRTLQNSKNSKKVE